MIGITEAHGVQNYLSRNKRESITEKLCEHQTLPTPAKTTKWWHDYNIKRTNHNTLAELKKAYLRYKQSFIILYPASAFATNQV